MITVHKLNGTPLIINAELIESLEPGKETVIALATGNRFVVRETSDEVTQKVLEYRRQIHAQGKAVNPIQGYQRDNS